MTVKLRVHARILLLTGLVLGTGPALAQSTLSTGSDCGGDAYSSAQVIENRPPRRGPLTAVPDTLCADVAPQGRGAPFEVGIDPYLAGQGLPLRDGGQDPGDPYEDRSLRFRRP